jgi:CBS domain-containing protein
MAQHNIGAVLVLEGQTLAGIFSERDYARKVALKGKSSNETKVSDVMTAKVITIDKGQTAYTVSDLQPATYYFALSAVNSAGLESALSDVRSKSIQ